MLGKIKTYVKPKDLELGVLKKHKFSLSKDL